MPAPGCLEWADERRPGQAAGEQLCSLLAAHGSLFSEQLGIRLDGLSSAELFKWFVASLLFGARITESVAVRTYRALERRGLLSPQLIAGADLARMAASHLKIGDLRRFWSDDAVSGYDFRHLEAAMTRIGRDFCRRRRCANA